MAWPTSTGMDARATSESATVQIQTQRRVTRACDNCKSRRTKCEVPPVSPGSIDAAAGGSEVGCLACAENGLTCTFEAPVRRRGPQPGTKKRPRLDPTLSPSSRRQHVPTNSQCQSHSRSPSQRLATPVVTDSSINANDGRASSTHEERPRLPLASASTAGSRQRHPQAHHHQHQRSQRRLPFGGVPSTLIDQLLPLYFAHVHNVWPLIYKATFNPHTTSAPLLLSMLAIAACVHPSPSSSSSTSSPSRANERDVQVDSGFPSERLFRMAEAALHECANECRLDLIQSLLLLSLRQTGCGDKQSAATYAGRACCMALNMGLNLSQTPRNGDSTLSTSTPDVDVEREVRSRVYWNTYVLDKTLAEETGRAFLLTYRRTTTPLPSTEEMEELETWPPSSHSTSAPSPISVLGHRQRQKHSHSQRQGGQGKILPRKGYVMSCFAWTCRLAMVVEDILNLDTICPPSSSGQGSKWDDEFYARARMQDGDLESNALEIAEQLDKWHKFLPKHLDVVIDDGSHSSISPLPHNAVGIAWYHSSRILLHSRFIRRTRSASGQGQGQSPATPYHLSASAASSTTARKVCSEAAEATMNILYCLDKYDLLSVASADMLHMLSLTALFQAFDTTNSDPNSAHRAKKSFAQCCRWLRDFSSSWPAASSHRLFFEGLIKGGLQISSTAPPILNNVNAAGRKDDNNLTPRQDKSQTTASTPGRGRESTPDGLRVMRRNLSISEDTHPEGSPSLHLLSDAATANDTFTLNSTTTNNHTNNNGGGDGDGGSLVPTLWSGTSPTINPSTLFQLPQLYWNSLNTTTTNTTTNNTLTTPAFNVNNNNNNNTNTIIDPYLNFNATLSQNQEQTTANQNQNQNHWSWDSMIDFPGDHFPNPNNANGNDNFAVSVPLQDLVPSTMTSDQWHSEIPFNNTTSNLDTALSSQSTAGQTNTEPSAAVQAALMSFMMQAARGQ